MMANAQSINSCEGSWGRALEPLASIIDADMNYFGTDNGAGAVCYHTQTNTQNYC
jgi:hypothetical protein